MQSAIRFLAVVAAASMTVAAAQTRFDHKAPGYVVPDKRVQVEANVTDPKGVKLARVYFKTPAQADYVFVPMNAAGGNRYVATVPAVNASAPSLQYVLLAVNNSGDVSKTQEYTVNTRKSNDTPAWQSQANAGEMKVYTEAATAPQTIAGFSDSISMDVAESTARFGATAGLLAHGAGGAAGGAAGSSGSAAGTSSATAASTGGLSTMAIVGGVAVAGLAAAAAGGGGGGGGGSAPPPAPTTSPFAGSWQGAMNLPNNGSSFACADTPEDFFLSIDAQGNISVTSDGGSNPTATVGANGAISISAKTINWGTCSINGTLSASGTGSGNASCNGSPVPPSTVACTATSGPWTARKL